MPSGQARQVALDQLKISVRTIQSRSNISPYMSEQSSGLHSSCRLLLLESRLNTSCIYHFCNFHGRDRVPLTKARACQAEVRAALFGCLRLHIVDNPRIFDRGLAIATSVLVKLPLTHLPLFRDQL